MFEDKITFDRFIRIIFTIAVMVCLVYVVNRLSSVLLPFFIAWLIAYLIHPIVQFFHRIMHIRSKVPAIIVTFILLLGAAVCVFLFFIPPIIEESLKIKELITDFIHNSPKAQSIPAVLNEYMRDNIRDVSQYINGENIKDVLGTVMPQIWNMLSKSLDIMFGIMASFIILMYLFFILLDYDEMASGWINLIPKKYRHFAQQLAEDLENGMSSYFRGQSLVALCVGVLCSIGFYITGFPMPLILGLFIGVLNLVPYMQVLAFVPMTILSALNAAETGGNFWTIFLTSVAVLGVVQVIQDMILVPKIMGKVTGMNPAVILLSLSVWGSLMGITGMIIALPLTTIITSYYKRFIINKQKITEPAPQEESGEKNS